MFGHIFLEFKFPFLICEIDFEVSAVESEVLQLTKASRLHMGPYLCIGNFYFLFHKIKIFYFGLGLNFMINCQLASNGVPPSVSQRIPLKIQCKYNRVAKSTARWPNGAPFEKLNSTKISLFFFFAPYTHSSANVVDSQSTRIGLQRPGRSSSVPHRSLSEIDQLLDDRQRRYDHFR